MKSTENKKLYKFLRTGLTSDHGGSAWNVGEWREEKKAKLCNAGFHASRTPLQALGYVKGEVIAEVEVRGKSDVSDDKEAWSEMRIVRAWHWTANDSVELAIFAAEQVKDDRPRKAIEAAKAYLAAVKEGDEKKIKAAADAADAADAAYAAYAAADAAYAAYAAADAAYAAADAAADAAGDKAYAEMVEKINGWFVSKLDTLKQYESNA